MTSPDGFMPGNALTALTMHQLQDVDPTDPLGGGANPDLQNLLGMLGATFINNLMGGFENIPEAIGEFLGELAEIFTGVEDGDFTDIGSWVGLLFGRDASLASRVQAIENKLAAGSEFYENFKRGDNNSALGSQRPVANEDGPAIAPWVQFGDGEQLGIHDQAAQQTRSAFPDDGIRYARCPFLATSPNYTVGVVIHPKGTPNQPATSIYGRCNADMTEGIYVDFFGNRCRMGRFTRSGLTMTRTQWGPDSSKSYSNSSTPKLRMVGTRYEVVIDDVVVLDRTDSSGYPIDMAHVTSGFSLQCFTAILVVPQWSGGLAAFAVSNANQSAIAQAVQTANGAATTAQEAQEAVGTVVEDATAAATTAAEAAAAAIGAAQQQQVNAVKSAIATVQSGLPTVPLHHSMTNHECSFDQIDRASGTVVASGVVEGVFMRPAWSGPRGSFCYSLSGRGNAALYIIVGRMDPEDGTVQIEYVSPDQNATAITGVGDQIHNFPTDIIFEPSELVWLAILQLGGSNRSIFHRKVIPQVPRDGLLFPATTRTRHTSASVPTVGTVLPQSTFDFTQTNLPWFGIGPSTNLPLPERVIYFEDFSSGSIPPTLNRQQGAAAVVIDGAIMLPGGFIDNGRRTYVVTQVMARDDHEVSGQVVSPTTRPQYLRVRSSVDLEVRSTGLTLSRGSDLTSIAMTVNSGDVFKLRAKGNVFTVMKLTGSDTWTVIPELTYTDSSNAIPRGRKYRYVSLGLNRSDFVNSGGWEYIFTQDLPDPV